MPDIYPANMASDVGRVRKYIPDLRLLDDPENPAAEPSYMWTDAEIESFLEDEGGNVKRAAAYILIATANNENLILKKLVTEDLQTDGPSVAKAMLASAQELLKRAEADDAAIDDAFFIVDYQPRPALIDWR